MYVFVNIHPRYQRIFAKLPIFLFQFVFLPSIEMLQTTYSEVYILRKKDTRIMLIVLQQRNMNRRFYLCNFLETSIDF